MTCTVNPLLTQVISFLVIALLVLSVQMAVNPVEMQVNVKVVILALFVRTRTVCPVMAQPASSAPHD